LGASLRVAGFEFAFLGRRLVAGLALTLSAPVAAFAGAWTLPPGEGQIIETLFGWTGSGAPYGGGGPAPHESRVEAQTYAEYGLWDSLTLFGEISGERYALSAPTPDVYRGLDYSGGGLRAKLWSNESWVISAEASAFASGAHDASRPAQAGNTGGAGEGRLLAGYNFTLGATPAFLDAELGFRLRTAGPADEWHGDATLGLKWTPRWMGLLQIFNTISTGSGNALFPAWSEHLGQVSVVYAIDRYWSAQFGAFATFATVNTNSQRGAMAAVWRRF
jgi:protein XagA